MIWFDEGEILQFDAERCCQCGGCLAACDAGALERREAGDGCFEIVWDEGSCTRCGLCVSVCPAPELPRKALNEEALGRIRAAYIGYAADGERRRSSSSGGVARSLVESALETGAADEAYCLVSSGEPPWVEGAHLERGFYPAVLANSTYRPVPFLENCRAVDRGRTLAVTGTNCQLLALERLYGERGVELLRIGLLCKQQKHLGFTRFIRRRLRMSVEEEEQVSYRGDGWPGRISSAGRSLDFSAAAALAFDKWLWTLPGCMYCANAMGETADLTIADPWDIVTAEESGGGMSMVAVNTEKGEALLAAAKGAIELERIETGELIRSIRWPDLKRKIDSIPVRLGEDPAVPARRRLAAKDRERRFYERLIEHFNPPVIVQKVLGKLPFAGL